MKRNLIKGLILSCVFGSLLIGVLAFTPHYTCGCGRVEDGTKLTFFINKVSENGGVSEFMPMIFRFL